MKKILSLVKVQIGTQLVEILSIGNNRKRKPKALLGGLVFFVLVLGGVSFFYSYMVGKGLMMFNSIDVLPALLMAVTSIIVLFTTTFKIKGTVFGFKDYDLVMSLPVRTMSVVASRLLLLYLLNMIFVCIVMIPAMGVYAILAKPEASFYIIGIFTLLFLPLIPIVVASVLGTIIAYAASRFRYSNLISIVFSLGLMVAIMGMSFTMGDTGQELVDISKALTDRVNNIYPPAEMYSRAITEYDITAFASFIGISALCFILYSLLVAKIFKKMNTIIMTGKSRSKYKLGELRQSSPLKALYFKEIKRYFSSPLYVLNTGFGIVMLTIGAIVLCFVDIEKLMGQVDGAGLLKMGVPVFITFCLVTCYTTAASISLEGKSLWIIKSLPVTAKSIFFAKIAVNLTVTAPALADVILMGFVLELGVFLTLLTVLITILVSIFISLFGLVINLKFPNFTWMTETVVIKQSAAAMIAVFTGMGISALLIALMVVVPSANLAYLIYIGFMAAVNVVLYRILIHWGAKQFHRL
ncbi:MAG: putative rane protein [Herbinix sp.]|jgi:ABC-2 type transport system permease protein|nr:putative rane protein [Herbinix sp.]